MTHHNLGLYAITYEKAEAVLTRAKKDSRWIANNTLLYRHVAGGKTYYRIKLHATDILTFYEDGSVRVSAEGWSETPTTRSRLRDYLPRTLSIDWGGMKTIRRPHVMIIKTDAGHVARPLGSNRLFRPDGTVEGLHLMNRLDALDIWKEVELFAKKFAQAFLFGKLDGRDHEVGRKDDNAEMEYALRLLKGEEPMSARPLNVAFVNWIPSREIFYKENYEYYSPTTPKGGVDLADWMERRISWDSNRFRPVPGSDRHQKFRKDVKSCVCRYFENALMYVD